MSPKAVCMMTTIGFQCSRLHRHAIITRCTYYLYDDEHSIQPACELRMKETVHLCNVFLLNHCVFTFSHIGHAPLVCLPDKVVLQTMSPIGQYIIVQWT